MPIFFFYRNYWIFLCSIRIISGVTSESAIYLTLIKYNIEILITFNIHKACFLIIYPSCSCLSRLTYVRMGPFSHRIVSVYYSWICIHHNIFKMLTVLRFCLTLLGSLPSCIGMQVAMQTLLTVVGSSCFPYSSDHGYSSMMQMIIISNDESWYMVKCTEKLYIRLYNYAYVCCSFQKIYNHEVSLGDIALIGVNCCNNNCSVWFDRK